MASNAPSQCCTVGVKHDGSPTGETIKISTITTYLATPPTTKTHSKTAILILPDVIGIWQNSQLIADQFAANGYLTLLVDTFNGDPLKINRPKDFDVGAWIAKGSDGQNPHTVEFVDPIVEKAVRWLREERGVERIGGVGYCFGAKYIIRNLTPTKGINVAYLAHPSFVEEDELRSITGPLSIAAADTDAIFPVEKRHLTEKILLELKQPYQITLYGGVEHGFSIRGDVNVKHKRFAKEQAFLQAVGWFDEFLM